MRYCFPVSILSWLLVNFPINSHKFSPLASVINLMDRLGPHLFTVSYRFYWGRYDQASQQPEAVLQPWPLLSLLGSQIQSMNISLEPPQSNLRKVMWLSPEVSVLIFLPLGPSHSCRLSRMYSISNNIESILQMVLAHEEGVWNNSTML